MRLLPRWRKRETFGKLAHFDFIRHSLVVHYWRLHFPWARRAIRRVGRQNRAGLPPWGKTRGLWCGRRLVALRLIWGRRPDEGRTGKAWNRSLHRSPAEGSGTCWCATLWSKARWAAHCPGRSTLAGKSLWWEARCCKVLLKIFFIKKVEVRGILCRQINKWNFYWTVLFFIVAQIQLNS